MTSSLGDDAMNILLVTLEQTVTSLDELTIRRPDAIRDHGRIYDISKKISEVSTYETDPDKNTASLKQIGRLVGQANQLIDQMNLEVRSLEAATRKQLQK